MKKIMCLISIGLIVTLLGCGAKTTAPVKETTPSTTVSAPAPAPAPPAPAQKKSSYAIGETFKLEDLQCKVNGVRVSSGRVMHPKDGEVFLLIDLTIENLGKNVTPMSSMMSFKLIDKDGVSQKISTGAIAEAKGKLDADIAPGGKITGEVGYSVKKGAQTFDLKFTPDPRTGKTATIKIPTQ